MRKINYQKGSQRIGFSGYFFNVAGRYEHVISSKELDKGLKDDI